MRQTLAVRTMLLALPLVACDAADRGGSPFAPEMAVAGQSGCYTVKVTLTPSPVGPGQFTGPITGDLEGTGQVQFTGSTAFTGVTNMSFGNTTWTITGGIIPELVGGAFTTSFDNRNILLPNTQLAKNLGRHRAVSGVDKANLSYTGQTSLVTGVTRLDHHGVICPST